MEGNTNLSNDVFWGMILILSHWVRMVFSVQSMQIPISFCVLACLLATCYAILAAIATPLPAASRLCGASSKQRRLANGKPAEQPMSPVSILKPLCGLEPRLFENLKTFCDQTFAAPIHLICGVSRADDTAIDAVRRLQNAYPHHDIQLVIDSRVHGSNLKVSNLINMEASIRHPTVVLADSDIAVTKDYLEQVTSPLTDPSVGVVTCLYRARSAGRFWARVGALFINEWFAPSVRIAHAGGSRRFGFGATLALRRETLLALGGFAALKDCLADDYWLAEKTRALGLKTVLSPVTVATDVIEPDLCTLWAREVRWLRTIRSVNGMGFALLFITFTSPWLLLGAAICGAWRSDPTGFAAIDPRQPALACIPASITSAIFAPIIATGTAARVLLHARTARHSRTFWRDLPLVPLRDTMLLLQWLCAAFGASVVWRGAHVLAINRVSPIRASDTISVTHDATPTSASTPITPLAPMTSKVRLPFFPPRRRQRPNRV